MSNELALLLSLDVGILRSTCGRRGVVPHCVSAMSAFKTNLDDALVRLVAGERLHARLAADPGAAADADAAAAADFVQDCNSG